MNDLNISKKKYEGKLQKKVQCLLPKKQKNKK